MSSDFFGNISGDDAPETSKPAFDGVPDGVTVLVRTTNAEDKETLHPKIKPFDRKDGTGQFFILKCPLKLIGGEKKLDAKFVGRVFFQDMNVEKPTLEQLNLWLERAQTDGAKNRLNGQIKSHSKYPCSPELYNFILDTLVPEDAPASERYPKAMAILGAKAALLGLDADKFGGNTQLLMAATFVQVLMDSTFTIIGKTYTPKQKEGSPYAPQQKVGSVGIDSVDQRKSRKVEEMAKPSNEDF